MKIKCPQCNQPSEWTPENEFRPFCSERCKLIDLGAWANEEHKINSSENPQDFPNENSGKEDLLNPTIH